MEELTFKQSLIPTLEESISAAELLERLGTLHEELSSLTQGDTNLESLKTCTTALVNKKLIKHKDAGVRAFVSCCISDIMRLYAPDAPFTESELTDIFKLYLSQFRMLRDPENGNFIQQTYLLTRLLECRSIVLIADLPQSGRLIEELFQVFYEKTEGEFPSKLWKIIGGLLTEVVSECESLSMKVLRLIFNAFLTHEAKESHSLKGLKVSKDSSFEFSLLICESASNRLGRHFAKFYSEILYGITNDIQGIQSVLDSTFRTLTKLHKLTAYIWEYSPELVYSVIGFVYQELCSDNVPLRIGATTLVSDILSSKSNLNFVTIHKDTYQVWLSKIADINAKVRIEWVKSIPRVIASRDDINDDISKCLSKTLIDTEENVRLQSIQTLAEIKTELIWNRLKDPNLFREVAHLIRDKCKDVRETCISYVSAFYDQSIKQGYFDRLGNDQNYSSFLTVVKEIPSNVLNLYYINDVNINLQVDTVIFNFLLPLRLSEEERIERLLLILSNLDEKALTSFFAFNKRQLQVNQAMRKLFEVHGEKLNKLIDWLASTLPQQMDGHAILRRLLELNDSRINHLIKVSVNQETSYPTLKNSLQELSLRLQDAELLRKKGLKFGSTFTKEHFEQIITILVNRGAPLVYNVSTLPYILASQENGNKAYASLRSKLVENISKLNPSLLKSQINVLSSKVTEVMSENGYSKHGQLKTLYKIYHAIPTEINAQDDYFLNKLEDFALKGNVKECQYAIKILSLIEDAQKRERALLSLKRLCMPLDFSNASPELLCNKLMILSQIFKVDFGFIKEDCNEITSFILKEILVTNEFFKDSSELKNGQTWIEDDDLIEKTHWPLAIKLISLELLTNRMISESKISDVNDSLETVFHKILKLFLYFVSNGGEVISEENETKYPTPHSYQRRIRCHAGLQILKLAKIAKFNKWIESKFIFKLINLVEDESFPVRVKFVTKLKHYVSNELISIKFIPLIFFMPFEPDVKFKTETKIWINFTFQKEATQRGAIFERTLPRLIHCIAHHPDIEEGLAKESSEDEFMTACAASIDYVLFYLDTVLKPENISLLYYLTGRVKQYKDILDEAPTAIYVISELIQMVLNELKKMKNMNLTIYSGKLNLPSDLFEPFENMELAQNNTFETFIKDEYSGALKQKIKFKCSKLLHGNSTTTKQIRQKRQLTNEYKSTSSPKKRKSSDNYNSDSDSIDVYPSPMNSSREPQRKSSRAKKSVRYNESEGDSEGEVA